MRRGGGAGRVVEWSEEGSEEGAREGSARSVEIQFFRQTAQLRKNSRSSRKPRRPHSLRAPPTPDTMLAAAAAAALPRLSTPRSPLLLARRSRGARPRAARVLLPRARPPRADAAREDDDDDDDDDDEPPPPDALRSATPSSATILNDPVTGRDELIYDVELPAVDMGITFRDAGGPYAAVVESVRENSAASLTPVRRGDVLVRCTATRLKDSDVLVTIGDGPPPRTKHVRGPFDCRGVPFDDVVAAVESSGVIDRCVESRNHFPFVSRSETPPRVVWYVLPRASNVVSQAVSLRRRHDSGVKHTKVKLEFKRDDATEWGDSEKDEAAASKEKKTKKKSRPKYTSSDWDHDLVGDETWKKPMTREDVDVAAADAEDDDESSTDAVAEGEEEYIGAYVRMELMRDVTVDASGITPPRLEPGEEDDPGWPRWQT